MPSPSDRPDDRIQELEERWKADPSSRIFVQLADEYRRQDRLADAIQVLEKGLRRQPNYLSAQVALGRCRLAAGDARGAVELLEPAVTQDPTHLVANKLLVEAYIETGRKEPARERLDLYSLMNDGDPDIETLRQRIETASPKAAPAPAAPAEKTPVEPPSEPGESMTGASTEAPGPEGPAPSPLPWPAEEPFGELWSPGRLRAWAAAFEAEGLFPLPPGLFPPLDHGPSQEPELEPEEEPIAVPADEPVLEAAPLETLPPEAFQSERGAEPAAAIRPAAGEERAATVTLGQLYMAQGHDDEAVRIFRAVLERDPENRVSREALELLGARQRPQPTPEETVGTVEEEVEPAVEEGGEEGARGLAEAEEAEPAEELVTAAPLQGAVPGLTERKIAVLKGYLERLRGGVEHDVS